MTHSLTLRTEKGSKLSIEEMDSNLIYLDSKIGNIIVATFSLTFEEITSTSLSEVTEYITPITLVESPGPNKFINILSAFNIPKNISATGSSEEWQSYLSITPNNLFTKATTFKSLIALEDLGNGQYTELLKYSSNQSMVSDSPIIFWADYIVTRVNIFTQSSPNRWISDETILGESSGATFSLILYEDDSYVSIPNLYVNNFIPGEMISGQTSEASAYLDSTIESSWQSDLLIYVKYEIVSLI